MADLSRCKDDTMLHSFDVRDTALWEWCGQMFCVLSLAGVSGAQGHCQCCFVPNLAWIICK
ncbi:hypothetical protein CKO18_16860 [Rhodoferax fermentans]|uniref:Uncharacterized protein n=1 Tax=Rhodoferax fermentans TaxID=28066 RepID=A0A1T1AW11_RHOFE|nr:hypothetical protein [Rhodoferax fermentans]OOV08148.1 hypothetical protein RF819_16745 [Rhodoferax fermentans]